MSTYNTAMPLEWLIVGSRTVGVTGKDMLMIKNILWQAYELSPSCSSFLLNLESEEESYKGILKVQCPSMKFKVKGESDELQDLLRKLKKEIIEQFQEWKLHRFQDEAI